MLTALAVCRQPTHSCLWRMHLHRAFATSGPDCACRLQVPPRPQGLPRLPVPPSQLAPLRLAQTQPAGGGSGAAVPGDSMAAASTDAGVAADPQEQPFTPSAFLAEAPSSDDDGPFAGSHLRHSPMTSGGGRQPAAAAAAAAAAAVATAASGVLDPVIAAIGMEGCAALRTHAHPPLAYHGLGREEGDALTVSCLMTCIDASWGNFHAPPLLKRPSKANVCVLSSPHMPMLPPSCRAAVADFAAEQAPPRNGRC